MSAEWPLVYRLFTCDYMLAVTAQRHERESYCILLTWKKIKILSKVFTEYIGLLSHLKVEKC